MNDDIGVSVNARRITLPLLILVLIILVLLRVFVVPIYSDSAVVDVIFNVIDNVIAAVLVSIFAGATLLWLTRDLMVPRPHLIKGRGLGELLEKESRGARSWRIRARTGSYFVRETLPRLVEDGPVDVDVLLMDPSKADALASYEALRSPGERERWSPERIRADILASLIRIVQYSAMYPRLNVTIGLVPGGWVQSLDISEGYSFLCGQESGDAALVVPSGNELYRRFFDDFDAAKYLARKVSLGPWGSDCSKLGDPEKVIGESTLRALDGLFLDSLGISLIDPEIAESIRESSVRNHHYFSKFRRKVGLR